MRRALQKFDLFPALPTLRAKGEIQVVNICGSIFSILIFGVFTYIFINNIVSTVKLENITAVEIVKTSGEQKPRVSNITIGVGIQQKNLTGLRHIFEFQAGMFSSNTASRILNVFPCTRDMWSQFSDDKYASLRLQTHMCIQRDGIQIYGQNGDVGMTGLFFTLKQCDNATSPIPCASIADINNYFNTSMSWGRFLACSMVILDTGFNPTQKDPYNYMAYEKTLWMVFNQNQQVMTQVFLGSYEINTDTNFLPFQTSSQQTGYFVSEAILASIVNVFNVPIYAQCFIFASPIKRVINRTYGKFDSILSYVGGLYGIVISFFAFFVLSYNQYKYELRVSERAFSFDNGHLARQDGLHFGKYLKYVIYDWIKILTCREINWADCRAIDEVREEANEQIDVKHLLKRISHLQKMMSVLVSTEEETIMQIAESYSISEAKHRRLIFDYCEKFKDSKKSITITNFETINALFSFNFLSNLGFSKAAVVPEDAANNSIAQINFRGNKKKSLQPIMLQQRNRNQKKSSLILMRDSLKKYEEKFQISKQDFNLSEQELQIQKQITEAFYALKQKTRIKIMKKIPLGILYRFYECHRKKQVQMSENTHKLEPMEINTFNQLFSKDSIEKIWTKHCNSEIDISNIIEFQVCFVMNLAINIKIKLQN